MAAPYKDREWQFVTARSGGHPSLPWIWGWMGWAGHAPAASSSLYFTAIIYGKGHLSTTFPEYVLQRGPWLWLLGAKGAVIRYTGNFLPGALTQLRSSKQGKFGSKSEGLRPSGDTANAQPTGNPTSCLPRSLQFFFHSRQVLPARATHHLRALLSISFKCMPRSPHTQKENPFVQDQCFRTLLSKGLLIRQQAKNMPFCWIYESDLDGVSCDSWHSKTSL